MFKISLHNRLFYFFPRSLIAFCFGFIRNEISDKMALLCGLKSNDILVLTAFLKEILGFSFEF